MALRSVRIAPVVLALCCFASASHAQHASPDLVHARALFDEAGELERQGHWSAAQERLRAALAIRSTPNLHYALGWALENDGKLAEARSEYELALRLARESGNEEVQKLASARLVDVPPTLLVNDDAGSGTQAERAPLATGPRARRAGVSPVVASVVIGAGAALGLTSIALFASSSADATTRDDDARKWCDATACVGSVTATRPESANATSYRREAADAASRGNTKQAIGGVLGGVGAIGVVVGLYLLLRKDASEAPASGITSALSIETTPRGGAGASASFVF